jgi:cephalosporin hydroxylase
MKIAIDTDAKRLVVDGELLPLYSKRAFELLSDLWLKVGWELKYPYTFSWLGFPILQIPEDMLRIQEVIFRLKPDVIVETGVAHGGSMIYYASLCKVMGHGRVIGIEKGLRCREAIEAHELSPYIELIEGSSTDPLIVGQVSVACEGQRVLMILDSDHSKAHVARELECYHPIIAPGSYIVASDGNMADLHDVPRGSPEWKWNNPQEAAREFAARHPEFTIEQPAWPFNESALSKNVTYWPSAFLRRA